MKDELTSIAWEILNGAKSYLGDYSLGNHVAVHREIIGRLSALLHENAAEHDWTGSTQVIRHVHCARCGKVFEIAKAKGVCTA